MDWLSGPRSCTSAWSAGKEVPGMLRALVVDEEPDDPLDHYQQDPDDKEAKASFMPHRITDVPCLLLFLVACVGLGFAAHYGHQNGDMRRLYHGINFLGELCGTENKTEQSFLYYCQDPESGKLDLQHPVCVQACPATENTTTMCFESAHVGAIVPAAVDSQFQQTFHYEFVEVRDYATYAVGGYCFPRDAKLFADIAGGGGSIGQHLLILTDEVWEGWHAVAASACIALACACFYLLMLRTMARLIVIAFLLIVTVAPIVTGGYLIAAARGLIDLDNIPNLAAAHGLIHSDSVPKESHVIDANFDLGLGIGLIVFGVVVGVIACCFRESINIAVDSIKAACECMFDCPTILLTPCLTLLWQVFCVGALGVGFLKLMATGEVQRMELSTYAQLSTDPTQANTGIGGTFDYMYSLVSTGPTLGVTGIGRTFDYSSTEWYLLFFYAYMIFWFVEIANALNQFALAYVTQIWYFSTNGTGRKSAPLGVLCKGVQVGVQFHLGSLALGACLVSAVRLARCLLGFLAGAKKDSGNPVAKAAAACCGCFLSCFEQVIRYLNKNAYMNIAMTSNNFCVAASHALEILAGNLAGAAVLNGACWVAQLAGIGAITAGSSWLTFVMCKQMDYFNNPESKHYVAEPLYVVLVGGVVAFLVAWTFMTVFDTVADALFYCYCVDRQYGDPEPADESGPFARSCGWSYAPVAERRALAHAPQSVKDAVTKRQDV